MKDETQKLLIAAIFSLATAYLLTNSHRAVANSNGDRFGQVYIYNTITGTVVTFCSTTGCQPVDQ